MIEGPEDGVYAKQIFSEHASKRSLFSFRSGCLFFVRWRRLLEANSTQSP